MAAVSARHPPVPLPRAVTGATPRMSPDLDPDGALAEVTLTTELYHGKVAAMNRENFVVRMHLEAVDRFRAARRHGRNSAKSDVKRSPAA